MGKVEDEKIKKYLDKHNVKYSSNDNFIELYKKLTDKDAHKFKDVKVSNNVKPTHFILLHYENGNHYKLVY